jgi:hypothetical protein
MRTYLFSGKACPMLAVLFRIRPAAFFVLLAAAARA